MLRVFCLVLLLQLQIVSVKVYAQGWFGSGDEEQLELEREMNQKLKTFIEERWLNPEANWENVNVEVTAKKDNDLKSKLNDAAVAWIGGGTRHGYHPYQIFYERESARERNVRDRNKDYYRYDPTISSTDIEVRFSPEEMALIDPMFHEPIRIIEEIDDNRREMYRRLDEQLKARIEARTAEAIEGID